MKKLTVLLMLVAFASFITGCSLSGKSSDAGSLAALGAPVNFSVSSELDGTISGSLRGATVYKMAEIEAMTIEIDGIVLPFESLISTNPIKIKFSKAISSTTLKEIVERNEPVKMVVKAAGVEVKSFEVVLPEEIADDNAAPEITISNTNVIEIKVTSTAVAKPVNAVETTGGIEIKELSTPVLQVTDTMGSDSGAAFKSGDTINYAQPVFLIALKNGSTAFDLTGYSCNFSFKVTKESNGATLEDLGKVTAAAPHYEGDNFFLGIKNDNAQNGILYAETIKNLAPGKYTVNIPQVVFEKENDKYRLKNYTYNFTVSANAQ